MAGGEVGDISAGEPSGDDRSRRIDDVGKETGNQVGIYVRSVLDPRRGRLTKTQEIQGINGVVAGEEIDVVRKLV